MFFSEHRVVSPSTVGWCGRRHEDGTVRFWDVSSSCMPHLYMLSTSHIFGEETVSSFEVASNLDTDYEWPPFRRVCTVIIIVDCCLLWMLNPVPWQNWMAPYLGYTLWMKTLFRGWQIMVHDTHTRRRRLLGVKRYVCYMQTNISHLLTHSHFDWRAFTGCNNNSPKWWACFSCRIACLHANSVSWETGLQVINVEKRVIPVQTASQWLLQPDTNRRHKNK